MLHRQGRKRRPILKKLDIFVGCWTVVTVTHFALSVSKRTPLRSCGFYRLISDFRFRIRSKNRLKIAQNRNISLRVVQNPPNWFKSVKNRRKRVKKWLISVFSVLEQYFHRLLSVFRSLRSRKLSAIKGTPETSLSRTETAETCT